MSKSLTKTGCFGKRRLDHANILVTGILSVFVSLATTMCEASGRSSDWEARAHMNYELGKELFCEVIVCETCPYSNLNLDNESVQAVWSDLKRNLNSDGAIGKNLRIGQRHAIRYFVQIRFEIPSN